MLRLVVVAGAMALMTSGCFAQGASPAQCQQVRQAVAQYGYAGARQYALTHYGPAAVQAGDRCLSGHAGTRYRTNTRHFTTHHWTRYRSHYRWKRRRSS